MVFSAVHKHYHFDHSEPLRVCPECGELILDNLYTDDLDLEDFGETYMSYEAGLKSRLMPYMWQLVALFCLFTVYIGLILIVKQNINPYMFYHVRFNRRSGYPLFGPYNEVIKCQVGIMFLSRLGFDKLAEYFGFPARRALGNGGEEFAKYWQLRFGLLIVFGILAYFCLPNYHGFLDPLFRRKAPVTETDMTYFNNYVLSSNLLFYPVYIFVVIKEIYYYRRSALILWLNGNDEE